MSDISATTAEAEAIGIKLNLEYEAVFPGTSTTELYLEDFELADPITFFVGPNGSGKSRTARALADRFGESVRRLWTDRLTGVMMFANYGWASLPQEQGVRGVPLGGQEETQLRAMSLTAGVVNDAYYLLRENPDLFLRVNAVLTRVFRREMSLTEQAGFLLPSMQFHGGGASYDLFTDEGHGLREIIALLTFTYERDKKLLIVDEPELHLHPSLTRYWLEELRKELLISRRKAILVTHDPTLILPGSIDDLNAIWVFREGSAPKCIGREIEKPQFPTIDGSLQVFPDIVSKLVFSARPVLVEGIHDRAALEAALRRFEHEGVVPNRPRAVRRDDRSRCVV